MSYHSPQTRSGRTLGTKTARMPAMGTVNSGNISLELGGPKLEAPSKPTISTDELGLATDAEKARKGYLSSYLEGQTPINKISNFLGGKRI